MDNKINHFDNLNRFYSYQNTKTDNQYKVDTASEFAFFVALLLISNQVATTNGTFEIGFFFGASNSQIKRICHLSEETIVKVKRSLKAKGLIDYKDGISIKSFKGGSGSKSDNDHTKNVCQYKILILPKIEQISKSDQKIILPKIEQISYRKSNRSEELSVGFSATSKYYLNKNFFTEKEKEFIQKESDPIVRERILKNGDRIFNKWILHLDQRNNGRDLTQVQIGRQRESIFIGLKHNEVDIVDQIVGIAIDRNFPTINWKKLLKEVEGSNSNPPEQKFSDPHYTKATFTKEEMKEYV